MMGNDVNGKTALAFYEKYPSPKHLQGATDEELAKFSGIAPVNFSSAGKGKDKKSKQGNRELYGVF